MSLSRANSVAATAALCHLLATNDPSMRPVAPPVVPMLLLACGADPLAGCDRDVWPERLVLERVAVYGHAATCVPPRIVATSSTALLCGLVSGATPPLLDRIIAVPGIIDALVAHLTVPHNAIYNDVRAALTTLALSEEAHMHIVAVPGVLDTILAHCQ